MTTHDIVHNQYLNNWLKGCKNYYKKNIKTMATVEEELQMVKTAHGRLFNQLKQLENDFNSLIVDANQTNITLTNKIRVLQEQIDNITIPPQPKEVFKDGNNYTSTIEEIITIEETIWDKKPCLNMEVKLVGRDELYKVFVLKGNKPDAGSKIRFTFDAADNKLKKLKVLLTDSQKKIFNIS